MSNLYLKASPRVGTLNPLMPVTVQTSAGYTTNPDFSRTPVYAASFVAEAQVQELSIQDLRFLEGLGIQGSHRSIYVNGEIDAIIRVSNKGGDLITLPDGTVWLTTGVLERWPQWCKVAVTEQIAGS